MTEQPHSLLVVDDDQMVREMLRQGLERHGYLVTTAEDGTGGLGEIEREAPDLLLLDIEMPGLDGMGVLRKVRERFTSAELPVIIVTARAESDSVVAALEAGANDYVTKPVDFRVVLARIGAHLQRKRAEAALRESEERYALAARGANDGLWDWNLKDDTVFYSPRWKSMLGLEDGEVGSGPEEWFSRVHPEDVARVRQEVADHLDGRSACLQTEHRVLHKEGHFRWILTRGIAIRDGDGRPVRMAGSHSDVTEGKVADALTGLPNRILFMDRLRRAIYRKRRRPDHLFAVLFIDLDRFKDINDSFGHLVGDELLIAVAKRLEASTRATDSVGRFTPPPHTVARFGGDEFTILLDNIKHMPDATLVAERLQLALAQPFHIEGHEIYTSTSIGIVADATGYERAEDLLRDADTAMYQAKSLGRSCYQVFDAAMREHAVRRLQLETDLQTAAEREEYRTYYQPIVSFASGRVCGFEVLVRWQHACRGLISPRDFIGVAEETGLIVPMGRFVLQEACRQLRDWQGRYPHDPPLMVSVNLSGKEFMEAGLVDQIAQSLKDTGIDAACLKLEITEGRIMEKPEAAAERFQQLRALGICLAIDDFGTGYSSLSCLHSFPVTTLKVDRAFVGRIGVGGENLEIVRTIVTLAHNLGLDVIAEGVETPEQLTYLKSLGCEYGQGYFFAEPLDAVEAEILLAQNPQW
jgi:diguanylate cyclase (GGDEF)-like protein/PAS domain S-box-containing protein